MNLLKRHGFLSKQQLGAFLTVVFSGELIYASFESFKIPFYQRLVEYYGLSDYEFGLLFTMLGVAVFFYVPGGWVNNRFNTKTILMAALGYRLVTGLVMIIFKPAFPVMLAITFTWGITDGIFWPAVVKGVVLFSGKDNKGIGLGLLTALRAGGEAVLNIILIGILALSGGSMLVFKLGMITYALFSLPMILLVWKFVPTDSRATSLATHEQAPHEIATHETEGTTVGGAAEASGETTGGEPQSGEEAWRGLVLTLKMPKVWLAGLVGMCVYWVYITLVYITPFVIRVYDMNEHAAPLYTTLNAIILGLSGGIVGGIISDKVFKSSALTIGVTLLASAGLLVVLAVIPRDPSFLWLAIVLLSMFAFIILMAKGIQQAPVAELHLPVAVLGSAMSVNSFMGFASILWAMAINGAILDAHKDNPGVGFSIIFVLMAGVGVVGAVLAWWLHRLNRHAAAGS